MSKTFLRGVQVSLPRQDLTTNRQVDNQYLPLVSTLLLGCLDHHGSAMNFRVQHLSILHFRATSIGRGHLRDDLLDMTIWC